MSKVMFIHIPKTGGMTLDKDPRVAKQIQKCDPQFLRPFYAMEVKAAFDAYGLNYQFQHCRYKDVDMQWRNTRKFACLIRNPWDRTVSQYFFAKKLSVEHGMTNETSVDPNISFEDFLQLRYKWGKKRYFWHRTTVGYYPQKVYVIDEDGEQQVDALRFEEYDKDTMAYFNLDTPIPKRNVSNGEVKDGKITGRRDYRDLYSASTRDMIGDWYQADIDHFGFTFDGGATKNYWNKV